MCFSPGSWVGAIDRQKNIVWNKDQEEEKEEHVNE